MTEDDDNVISLETERNIREAMSPEHMRFNVLIDELARLAVFLGLEGSKSDTRIGDRFVKVTVQVRKPK